MGRGQGSRAAVPVGAAAGAGRSAGAGARQGVVPALRMAAGAPAGAGALATEAAACPRQQTGAGAPQQGHAALDALR
jgi:hypothetical protein